MFELYSADTPNGKKISIMLEELNLSYKVKKVNIMKGDQFKSSFSKMSPFNKIPVLKDLKAKKTIFESGAILIYLGEKYKKFYDKKDRLKILQWLMAQMAYIGPMIG
ncbi:MAG: glutathione S-transferase family protein, partial [Pelagibacteraceae bacterium]